MSRSRSVGKPTTRRYSPEEKVSVRTLRAELGADHGATRRVASQVGSGQGCRSAAPDSLIL